MVNLIKNELTKIFHKKAIYIVLIITLGFMILNSVLTKVFEDDVSYTGDDIGYYQEQLSYLDKNNPEDKELYIMLETEMEIAKLKQKYGITSWQSYILDIDGYEIIQNMKVAEGTTEYSKYENEYNEFVEKLDKDDWRHFATEELNSINEQIEQVKSATNDEESLEFKNLQVAKQALEWRLDKDISYGDSNMNTFIDRWSQGKYQINQIEEDAKTQTITYQKKYENQLIYAQTNIAESAIINGVPDNVKLKYINDAYILSSESDSELINVFSSYSLFILIAVLIVAGTIMSEEFNKGTIKLLLVRPYNRTKILAAKFIACLIILVVTIVAITLMQTIIGGITYGFGDYTSQVVVYNFDTSSVQNVGLLQYVLLTIVCKLPMFILLMTLAFALSTLFNNSPLAIAIPLLGTMGAELINQFAYYYEKARFLMYFVTPNWDLTIFLYGNLPRLESLSLPFSIVICIIYFVIMIAASLLMFKKRDIKNI